MGSTVLVMRRRSRSRGTRRSARWGAAAVLALLFGTVQPAPAPAAPSALAGTCLMTINASFSPSVQLAPRALIVSLSGGGTCAFSFGTVTGTGTISGGVGTPPISRSSNGTVRCGETISRCAIICVLIPKSRRSTLGQSSAPGLMEHALFFATQRPRARMWRRSSPTPGAGKPADRPLQPTSGAAKPCRLEAMVAAARG